MRYATAALLAVLTPAAVGQAQQAQSSIGLTIYSNADPAQFDPQQFISQQRIGHDPNFAWQVPGFGVVRETRQVELPQGVSTLNFVDVARFIDPTTVSFVDLDHPDDTTVLEQTFLFDLVSPEKLLENYLEQPVTLRIPTETGVEEIQGILLSSVQGQLVVQTQGGVRIVPRAGTQVLLGEMPGGMITRPTLQWLLGTHAPGPRNVRTSYQTNGITWRADYNLILNEDDSAADLGAWVTILNLSGKTYPNAELKLIAGDVQRIQPQPPTPMRLGRAAEMAVAMDGAAGFEQRAFFEYHLYTLPRPATVNSNTTQQITLFPTATGVEVERLLVYYGLPQAQHWGAFPQPQMDRQFGNQSNRQVDVYIRFANEEDNQLGVPLPKGKMRVFKMDGGADGQHQGSLEFVGEDLIDHTPRDEKVLIRLGSAFDVVGERTQTNFTRDDGRRTVTESFRVQIRNHKDVDEKVIIKENLYRWTQWEITDTSDEFEKVDARTIHFEVEVPSRGEKTVEYTVRYTW